MRKAIAISVCVLLGLATGYFAAPPASMWYIQWTEPDMFGAFALNIVEGSIVCGCENKPPREALETVSDGLSTLRRWRDQNRSLLLTQEIGLGYVRQSQLEQKLGQNAQADNDMKHAQDELAVLGWIDTSAPHLMALVTQMDAGYKTTGPQHKVVTAVR
ncbi:MAG: hypothetical protein ACRD4H_08910 [Candidatus Acidiferrales bacterium]